MVCINSILDVGFDFNPMKSLGGFANSICRCYENFWNFLLTEHYLQNEQILGLLHICQHCDLHIHIVYTKHVVDVQY